MKKINFIEIVFKIFNKYNQFCVYLNYLSIIYKIAQFKSKIKFDKLSLKTTPLYKNLKNDFFYLNLKHIAYGSEGGRVQLKNSQQFPTRAFT